MEHPDDLWIIGPILQGAITYYLARFGPGKQWPEELVKTQRLPHPLKQKL